MRVAGRALEEEPEVRVPRGHRRGVREVGEVLRLLARRGRRVRLQEHVVGEHRRDAVGGGVLHVPGHELAVRVPRGPAVPGVHAAGEVLVPERERGRRAGVRRRRLVRREPELDVVRRPAGRSGWVAGRRARAGIAGTSGRPAAMSATSDAVGGRRIVGSLSVRASSRRRAPMSLPHSSRPAVRWVPDAVRRTSTDGTSARCTSRPARRTLTRRGPRPAGRPDRASRPVTRCDLFLAGDGRRPDATGDPRRGAPGIGHRRACASTSTRSPRAVAAFYLSGDVEQGPCRELKPTADGRPVAAAVTLSATEPGSTATCARNSQRDGRVARG